MKNTMLWSEDFYDNYKDYEDAKKSFGDLIMERCGYESMDEITHDDILEEFNDENRRHYNVVKDALLAHDKGKRPLDGGFLVLADLGKWDGRFKGGKIIGSLLSVLNECSSDYDSVKYEIKDNNLVITGEHHDSTDYFTVFYITEKGMNWAMRNYGSAMHRDRQCHEHLRDTKGFTRKMFTGNWKFER